MVYELLDTDGFNLVGAFDSESEAIDELRGLVLVNGFDYVRTIALVTSDAEGKVQVIATGLELAQRADIHEFVAVLP